MNVVSGVLKLYFRELPEPLIPTELFQTLARTLGKTRRHVASHICYCNQEGLNQALFFYSFLKFEAIGLFGLPL